MKNIVVLFSGTSLTIGSLFKKAEMISVYQNFIRIGREEGISVFISVPSLMDGKIVKKAITYQGDWKRVNNVQADYVFDKLSYGGKRKQIIRKISRKINVINNPALSLICDNKLITYKTFPHLSPQTFDVTRENFREVIKKIRSRKIVFKPWYGSHGDGIIIKEKSQARFSDIRRQYIAQEYVDTRGGIKGIRRPNSLRILVINGEIVLISLFVGKREEIVSGNVKAVKVSKKDIPFRKIKIIANEIDFAFRAYYPRFYCVDFSITKEGRIYIGEINSKPGLFTAEGEKKADYDRVIKRFFRSLQ